MDFEDEEWFDEDDELAVEEEVDLSGDEDELYGDGFGEEASYTDEDY